MGSYAFITIAGYPIESTKNDFYEWYFRKSERRIVKCKRSERNKLIWGSLDAGDADEIEENYIYDTAASALRRRLELAGYTRSTLEREFAEALAQRLAYAEDYAARHNDCRHHIPLLQSASLDQWLGKLRQIIEQRLYSRIYGWDWGIFEEIRG